MSTIQLSANSGFEPGDVVTIDTGRGTFSGRLGVQLGTFWELVVVALRSRGYGRTHVVIGEVTFGHVRAEVLAPIPSMTLEAIGQDLAPFLPAWVRLDVFAQEMGPLIGSDPERILAMAMRAIDDPSVLQVLGDMVLECGWVDPRVDAMLPPLTRYVRDLDKWRPVEHAAHPSTDWARALVAVHLFGQWDTDSMGLRRYPWPVVRASVDTRPFFEVVDGGDFSNEFPTRRVPDQVFELLPVEPSPQLPGRVERAKRRDRRGIGGAPLGLRTRLKPWER